MLRVIFTSIMVSYVVVCDASQAQNGELSKNSKELIQFLAKKHYLDGTRRVEQKNIGEVKNMILSTKKQVKDWVDDLYIGSFAPNVALVAAQVGLFDIAADLLLEYGEPDWLFDKIESKGEKVKKESILKTLEEIYPSN